MAAIAVRRPEIARLGYFDDFGSVARESAVHYALEASASSNKTLDFELETDKSKWGVTFEFPGAGRAFSLRGERAPCSSVILGNNNREIRG